jgi:hypothetical protein
MESQLGRQSVHRCSNQTGTAISDDTHLQGKLINRTYPPSNELASTERIGLVLLSSPLTEMAAFKSVLLGHSTKFPGYNLKLDNGFLITTTSW